MKLVELKQFGLIFKPKLRQCNRFYNLNFFNSTWNHLLSVHNFTRSSWNMFISQNCSLPKQSLTPLSANNNVEDLPEVVHIFHYKKPYYRRCVMKHCWDKTPFIVNILSLYRLGRRQLHIQNCFILDDKDDSNNSTTTTFMTVFTWYATGLPPKSQGR